MERTESLMLLMAFMGLLVILLTLAIFVAVVGG
jgi:hypothetical protein